MAASAGAWYRVGTVNVTNGNATVVGVGSNWQNDVIATAIGDAFTIDAKTWYEVVAVNSDTSITLDRGFEGATASGVEYAILRNTSGTILTRIAGQVAVQFNQKQLFLDELRNWLTSDDETVILTDSHGIAHVVKTVNKIQALTGNAADRDVATNILAPNIQKLMPVGYGAWGSPDSGGSGGVDFSARLPMAAYPVHILDSTGDKPEANGFGTVFSIAGTTGNASHQLYFSRNVVTDRLKYRTKRNSGVEYDPWVTIFDSMNSVNPLDYGLGAVSASGNYANYRDMTLRGGGFGFFSSASEGNTTGASISTVNLPTNVPSSSAKISLTHSATAIDMYIERVNAGVGLGMEKVYHSGNSVNPLDHGLGSTGAVSLSDADINSTPVLNRFIGWSSGTNAPSGVPQSTGMSGARFSAAASRYADMLISTQGVSSATPSRAYIKSWDGASTHGWQEVYTSGNVSFNAIVGTTVGKHLGEVLQRNSTTAMFKKDISGFKKPPSSIAVTGTFKIVTKNGANTITGIAASDLALESFSSNTRLIIRISNIDTTVMSPTEDYELAAESINATIEFNE